MEVDATIHHGHRRPTVLAVAEEQISIRLLVAPTHVAVLVVPGLELLELTCRFTGPLGAERRSHSHRPNRGEPKKLPRTSPRLLDEMDGPLRAGAKRRTNGPSRASRALVAELVCLPQSHACRGVQYALISPAIDSLHDRKPDLQTAGCTFCRLACCTTDAIYPSSDVRKNHHC